MRLKRLVNALRNRARAFFWRIMAISCVFSCSRVDVKKNELVLIFAPEGAVVPHVIGLCIIARTLMAFGYDVKLVRCFNLQKRCVAMDASSFSYKSGFLQRVSFCLSCLSQSLRVAAFYGVEAIDLRDYLTAEIQERTSSALTQMPMDIREFEYDGVPFGKISMAGLALVSKATLDDKVGTDLRQMWLDNVETSLLIYNILSNLVRQSNISRVIYFNDYPVNMVARVLAEKNNIPCFTLSYASHKNVDRSRFVFFPIHTRGRYFFQRSIWEKWRSIPLNADKVKSLTDDIIHRVSGVGSHIYSPGKTMVNIRDQLGVPNGKKLIAAYTSSLDEIVAGFTTSEAVGHKIVLSAQPFGNDLEAMQIDWLRSLVKHVAEHEDRYLVVRIHPREGAVKGEKAISQRLQQLKADFGGIFQNCRFIWPEDPVSSFDLGEAADLVLVGWSTIGVELARLGVPVLSATHGVSPWPDDRFLVFEETQNRYFERLDRMLLQGVDEEALRLAYRWTNLFYHGNSIDLSDVVSYTPSHELPKYRVPRDAKLIDDVLSGRRDILDINLERLLNSHGTDPNAEEEGAIAAQVCRLVHVLCTGEDRTPAGMILFHIYNAPTETILEQLPTSYDRSIALVLRFGQQIYYLFGGCVFSRYSPMVTRLAVIGAKKSIELSVVSHPTGNIGLEKEE